MIPRRSASGSFIVICRNIQILDKNKALAAIAFLTLFALMAQYSCMNGFIISKINLWPYPKTYVYEPLGRLCEMISYATIGIVIKEYKVFDRNSSSTDTLLKISFSLISVLSLLAIKFFTGNSMVLLTERFCLSRSGENSNCSILCGLFYLLHQILVILKLNRCQVWGGKLHCKICNGNIFLSKIYCFSIVYDWGEQVFTNE